MDDPAEQQAMVAAIMPRIGLAFEGDEVRMDDRREGAGAMMPGLPFADVALGKGGRDVALLVAQEADREMRARSKIGRLAMLRASATMMSGGSSEIEVKELTVRPPTVPSSSAAVTTAMPVGKRPSASRNCRDVKLMAAPARPAA